MRRTQGLTFCVLAAVGIFGVNAVHADPATEGFRMSREELLAGVAKTTDGRAGTPLPTGPDALVIEMHREKSGDVELHKTQDDVFVAHAGKATVIIGAEVEGSKETGPGEWRGGTIKQPRQFEMAPGDVLWIPAGLPHQVIVPNGGSFNYLAFKYDVKAR